MEEKNKMNEEFLAREKEQDAKEKENAELALKLQQTATTLAQKERDLALEKSLFYENLYNSVTKKSKGIGCTLKRIFSLGFARCG